MLIRPLQAGDRAQWDRLWSDYLRFYGQDLAPKVTDTTWWRLVDPDEDLLGLCVLGLEGEMVSFVHYLFHPVTWSGDQSILTPLIAASHLLQSRSGPRSLAWRIGPGQS